MKIALLISFSDYHSDEASDLPGCEADLQLMQRICENGDFSTTKVISGSFGKSGEKIKLEIAEFIDEICNQEIETFLFYFSGHGRFHNDEFNYVLPGYKSSRSRQTSLSNSELDGLIRSTSPALTVKIVDACESGAQYIKDPETTEKYVKASAGLYNSCYFLFSSQRDQNSFQTILSDFTNCIGKAIKNSEVGPIRYKALIDFISDDFEKSDSQTPYFVIQGSFTDVFVQVDDHLVKDVSKIVVDIEPENKGALATEDKNLLKIVGEKSEIYCSKDEILEYIDSVHRYLGEKTINGDLNSLFNLSLGSLTPDSTPNRSEIGDWLGRQSATPPYLASPVKEKRTERLNILPFSSSFSKIESITSRPSAEPIEREISVVTGFRSNLDTYEQPTTVCEFIPRYPALKKYNLYFSVIPSRINIVIFTKSNTYIDHGFGDFRVDIRNKWHYEVFSAKRVDLITSYVDGLWSAYLNFIRNDIAKSLQEDSKATEE
nr:caspase family protein [Jiella avicenniae]